GDQSIALGWNAIVFPGATNTALGANSEVAPDATNSVALGNNSYADRPNTVSVGTPARISDGQFPIDIPAMDRQITHVAAGTEDTDAVNVAQLNAATAGARTTAAYFQSNGAADAGAQATADNSVAIGAGSLADVTNTFSVGSAGNYRRVVNVADPVDAHDAVTLGYLQANYSTSSTISNLSSEIDALNKQVASLQGASGGVANDAALAQSAAPAQSSGVPTRAASAPALSGESQQAVASANGYTDQQTAEALHSAQTYADSASA